MRTKKLLSVIALACALFCSTVAHGQERLWVFGPANTLISVNKDGSDLQSTGQFNSDRYGGVRGFAGLPDGEVFLSTEFDAGDFFGWLSQISATGLDTIYQLGYVQFSGNAGMTVGENGKVYVPFRSPTVAKLVGVLVSDPGALTVDRYNLYTQPFSADYYLTSTPDGIYGVSRGNSNYKGGIFRLDQNNPSEYEFVYQFTGGANGQAPRGVLTLGQDGYLFGRTTKGGLDNKGIYYKVKLDGTSFTKLFDIATGSIGEKDGSGKFQRLLDLMAQGYLPVRDNEGDIYHNANDGIYRVGEDGYPILKVTDLVVDRFEFITPSFNHVVTVNNIPEGSFDQPLSLAISVNSFKGAARYDLQVSTTADFSNIVQTLSSTTPGFVVTGLAPSTDYYVRARPNIYPYWGQATHFSTMDFPMITDNRIWTFSFDEPVFSILEGDTHSFNSIYHSPNTLNDIHHGIPLLNGEKILLTDGEGSGDPAGLGEVWKVTSQGVFKLYDFPEYPDFARFFQSGIDGGDGYVYALNFAAASSYFTGILRFKIDGSGYESVRSSHPVIFNGAQIARASDGIYGTAPGVNENKGLIFKLRDDISGVDAIFNFTVDSLGARPHAELTEGRDEYLYGTAREGGRYGGGVIFKIRKDGTDYTVLHHFQPPAGKNPDGKIIQGSDGWLYGTTPFGGNGPAGVVYKIFEDGTGFQKLSNFPNTAARFIPKIAVNDQYLYAAAPLRKYLKDGTLVQTYAGFKDVWIVPSVPCDTYVINLTPGETGVPQNVVVLVKEMKGATHYFIEVSTSADFSTYERISSDTTVIQLDLEANTTYHTRVFSSLLPDPGPTVSFTTRSVGNARVAAHDEDIYQQATSQVVGAYPNPSRGGFNIVADPSEVNSMVLTEANGNVVYHYENRSGTLPDNIGSQLARGVYLLHLKTREGLHTIRLVKQ